MGKRIFISINLLLILLFFTLPVFNAEEISLPKVIEQAWPSVVQVKICDKKGEEYSGTGFFVFPGKILTNAHVVEKAFSAAICFLDEIEYERVTLLKIDHYFYSKKFWNKFVITKKQGRGKL